MQLVEFQILTFDCYGTLIDWETGITKALRPLLARRSPIRQKRCNTSSSTINS
jgi:FMN phosphatase YigB (HAD superfamily)